MSADCGYVFAFAICWIVAVLAWGYGLSAQIRAGRHFRPPSFFRSLHPGARLAYANYAPIAIPFVARLRRAVLVFLLAALAGFLVGGVATYVHAGICVL